MYIYQSLELEFFRKVGNVGLKFVICTAYPFLSILSCCLRWCWFWRRRVATWISCWTWRERHLRRWLVGCWRNIAVTEITDHLVIKWRIKIVKRKTRSSRLVLLMKSFCFHLRNQLTDFHSCFCNYTGKELRNSLCHTFEECKNRTTKFWFFCFFVILLRICNRSSRPRKMSARSFSFWLTTLCFFFSDPSLRLLSFCRFCLKLQSSRDSCSLSDALTPSYSTTSSTSSSLVFPCPSSFIEPWSKLSLLLVDSCVSSLSIVHRDLKQHNSLK